MPDHENLYTLGNKWKCGCICNFPAKKEDVEKSICPECTAKENLPKQSSN